MRHPKRCRAEGCDVEVPSELLMCRRHWFMVPAELRRRVQAAYRPGQCGTRRVSDEWRLAARAAVAAVKAKERPPQRTLF